MPTATHTAKSIVIKNPKGFYRRPWEVLAAWPGSRVGAKYEFPTKGEGVAWVEKHLAEGAYIDRIGVLCIGMPKPPAPGL